jgi:signal transduction histidine kinase
MSRQPEQPSAAHWQAAFQAAPDPYLLLSPELVILDASDGYLEATMTRREQIVGRSLFEVFPENPEVAVPDGVRNLRGSVRRVLETKAPDQMPLQKYDIRTPGEEGRFEERIWSALNTPVLGADGAVVAILHRAEDVTQQVRRQEELSSQDRATQAMRSMADQTGSMADEDRARLLDRDVKAQEFAERLLGIVGHDLRNPLSAVVTSASTLSRVLTAPDQQKRVKQILSSAGRMERIISNLLDYTRVRSGTLTLVRRRIDAHQVCRRAVRELQVSHPDRTIVVQAHGDATFDLDPDRLERVLSNLVGNAIKYGAPAEPVMVVTWGEKTMWTLQVSNGGKPIPAELLPRLFSPFERGPQSEGTVKQSLGLGLYIVQELVGAHGGTVSVSSAIGRTVFTVRLPRYIGAEKEPDDPLHSSGGG